MPAWLTTLLVAAGSVILTATVNLIFNKVVGIPAAIKKQREEERKLQEKRKKEDAERDRRIALLETAVNAYPAYRTQSLQIQTQLRQADSDILHVCERLEQSIVNNQEVLLAGQDAVMRRLDRLESREKNSLRAKILTEHRLFTDTEKNPQRAWSEMEYHAFFQLVRDYEDLGGNDYVHHNVIPDMNRLNVIPMTDLAALESLMHSRKM